MPSRCRADAEATAKQHVAEEMRGPPSGRAQEGRRTPRDEVNGFPATGTSAYGFSREASKFYFKSTFTTTALFFFSHAHSNDACSPLRRHFGGSVT
jgi:hypothetical protein